MICWLAPRVQSRNTTDAPVVGAAPKSTHRPSWLLSSNARFTGAWMVATGAPVMIGSVRTTVAVFVTVVVAAEDASIKSLDREATSSVAPAQADTSALAPNNKNPFDRRPDILCLLRWRGGRAAIIGDASKQPACQWPGERGTHAKPRPSRDLRALCSGVPWSESHGTGQLPGRGSFALVPGQDLVPFPWPSDLADHFTGDLGAALAVNGAAVFYIAGDMNQSTARVARHDETAGWAATESIGLAGQPPVGLFGGAVDERGRAVAYDVSTYARVIVSRFTPDHGWSGPLLLAYSLFNGRLFTSADRRGNVIIAWGGFCGDNKPSTDHVAALRYVVNP
jgi:hypothetical protein